MAVTVNEAEFLFVEKYRPQNISECILPERIKSLATSLVQQGQISNLLFSGSGGVGKTTLAQAIANELGCDNIIINCSNENGIDTIRTKLTQFASSVSLDGQPKIVIMDESDGLTPQGQQALRNFIEQYSRNCRFIFTCNFKNKLIEPLHSRLTTIDFTLTKEEKAKVVVQFFKRVCEILDIEGITYDKPVVAKLVEKGFPDFRRILGDFQKISSQTGGSIDASAVALIRESDMSELFVSLRDKDFKKMRSWVVANSDLETTAIVRKITDSLNDVCMPHSIPNMYLILAEYSYKAAFVADKELNLVACFIEMMANGEWK